MIHLGDPILVTVCGQALSNGDEITGDKIKVDCPRCIQLIPEETIIPLAIEWPRSSVKSKDFILCECIDGESERQVIRDILDMFRPMPERNVQYLDTTLVRKPYDRYTQPVVNVILSLLDRLDYIEHSGSLESSANLTPHGENLKDQIAVPLIRKAGIKSPTDENNSEFNT